MLTQGPFIEPIIHSTRTSVNTATVRQVECKNFPAKNQVEIAYYDGEECLGKFATDQDHTLTNLTELTKTITARSTDAFGNLAEATFDVSQDVPFISYDRICRTPTSVVIKGVRLENFPNATDVTFTYTCDDHETINCGWDQEDESKPVEHHLPEYSQDWEGGTISMTATDGKYGYFAESQIDVIGAGNVGKSRMGNYAK